ncbi:MAG: SDR family NAD(P)-dependent oxidoreductase [Candidatus Brocadiae bacterium]|nr:SDR family NAD(P)-dependent oxidoreductase [Candidatus Brocadiia bacterium]
MKKKIAVVSMGCLLPDALDTESFWQNVLEKKVSIGPLPEEIFPHSIYYRPDLVNAVYKKDKSVTHLAGMIRDLKLDVSKYKIPPAVALHLDENQKAILYVTDMALSKCQWQNVSKDRIAVVVANGANGTRFHEINRRVHFQKLEDALKKTSFFQAEPAQNQEKFLAALAKSFYGDAPTITEDTAPGVLPSLVAGRVANVFDIHGPAYVVDAACASSLVAIMEAASMLQSNRVDLAIAGAADLQLDVSNFVCFSAINALSPDGSFPFDIRANGFVTGQGAGAVILKRLEDAIQDKDHIHAIITGYAQTSDGKGKYIAAPNEEGQAKAIQMACLEAGYSVDTIEMMEAHGTSTKVGDVVEVAALNKSFKMMGCSKKNFCGLGSVKSNIGHLKSAAGMPGFLKAVLALDRKVLPPTANFQTLNPNINLEDSPFYILNQPKPWQEKEHPRRANVSSFGFGGANAHIALEEYRPSCNSTSIPFSSLVESESQEKALCIASERKNSKSYPVFFSGNSLLEIPKEILPDPSMSFAQKVFLHNSGTNPRLPHRICVLASSYEDLKSKLSMLFPLIQNQEKLPQEILYQKGNCVSSKEIAILFPGQASQYPGMFRSLYDAYFPMQSFYQQMDAFWFKKHGKTVSSLIFQTGQKADESLQETIHAHPALFASNLGMYRLLEQMGIFARYMLGHSLGEICALCAGGMLGIQDAMEVISERAIALDSLPREKRGKMLAVSSSLENIQNILQEHALAVDIANRNAPNQMVLSGLSEEIERCHKILQKKSIGCTLLPVSHAFHSKLMSEAARNFYKKIQNIEFLPARVRVIMGQKAEYYPGEADSSISLILEEQICKGVNFAASMQRLYNDGVRLFLEVGPGSVLTHLGQSILKDTQATFLTMNERGKDDWESYQNFLGRLFVSGVPLSLIPDKEQNSLSQGSPTILQPKEEKTKDKIVYSGVSMGLPGSYKKAFQENNFDQLCEGRNMIERLTQSEKQKMLDLHITKLVKSSQEGPTLKLLSSLEEVIQIAGKIGKILPWEDYQIEEKSLKKMTTTILLGVAAGYEALADAGIPLVEEFTSTSTGSSLPTKRWVLPKEMQEETGVVFANGFPMIEPFLEEASRYIAYKYGNALRKDIMGFYEKIIGKIQDPFSKKLLSDWYSLHYSILSDAPGEEEMYRFNHSFMDQVAIQANNSLAMAIGAKGPNFQINSACSSTVCAITLCEALLKTKAAKRMIIIGADNATSSGNFPWLGAGFLSTGAASNEGDIYEAAVPFDQRRNGMIVGAGAIGIVLEIESEVQKRGMEGICDLLGSQSFNTAKHPSQIDKEGFAVEMNRFISRMEKEHGWHRDSIASKTVYLSHETSTPPRGGCSQTEANALRSAFPKTYSQILITNTKAMTGHTMGASIEDIVAARCLQYQKVPPVVNCTQPDPEFRDLLFSQGGTYSCEYALHLSAGFGSQGNFVLLKKKAKGNSRIASQNLYQKWLESISGNPSAVAEMRGKILIVSTGKARQEKAREIPPLNQEEAAPIAQKEQEAVHASTLEHKDDEEKGILFDFKKQQQVQEEILQIFSHITQYPPEMLELEMEMEADLGIDTVKQATILSMIAEKFGFPRGERLILSNYPTIGHVVEFVMTRFSLQNKKDTSSQKSQILETRDASPILRNLPQENNLSRQIITLCEESLSSSCNYSLEGKNVLLVGESNMVMTLADLGKQKALTTSFLLRESPEKTLDALRSLSIPEPCDVILDCSTLGKEDSFAKMTEKNCQEAFIQSLESRFVFYQHIHKRLEKKPRHILCLISMDGFWGQELPQSINPILGAIAGFYKGLRKEWKESQTKIIDFSPEYLQNLPECMEIVAQEIQCAGLGVEIAYKKGKRYIIKTQDKPFQAQGKITMPHPQTILVTGGGTGITEEIVSDLAKKEPVNLIILGSTPLPDNISDLASMEKREWEEFQEKKKREILSQKEKPTPAMLQKALQQLAKARDIYCNLERWKEAGCKVLYFPCDVRNYDAMKLSLQKAKESFGSIHAILHGAGREASHSLDQKSLQEFQDVFYTKVLGACHLFLLCHREPLKWVCALGSISGRFGNEAQIDYCAANQFLSHWTQLWHALFPQTHAVCFSWSGWKEKGMASRNDYLMESATSRGMGLIEIQEGVSAFWEDMLHFNQENEVIYHKGLSNFQEKELSIPCLQQTPFLDRIAYQKDGSVKAYRILSVERDAMMDQHRLGNVPILPAVGSLELCAEYYALRRGIQKEYLLESVSFENPMKLFREQPREIYLEGEKISSDKYKIALKSLFYPANSLKPEILLCSQATVSSQIDKSYEKEMRPEIWSYRNKATQSIPGSELLSLFHKKEHSIHVGPLYQYYKNPEQKKHELMVEFHEQGLIYPIFLPWEQMNHPQYPLDKVLLNPCFLDSLMQAVAGYCILTEDRIFLPWKIREMGIVRVPREAGQYTVYVQVLEKREEEVSCHAVMLDSQNQICYYGKDIVFHRIQL